LTHRSLTTGAAAVLLALSVSACGGGSDDTGAQSTQTSDSAAASSSQPADAGPTSAAASSGPQEAESSGPQEAESITATEADFSIALDEDSLAAGAYEIQVANQGRATHDLVVERDGKDVAASDSIGPGESTTLTVTLEPGEYVFYCSIGNHRSMGMEITVQVT
jgi:plastocyanin